MNAESAQAAYTQGWPVRLVRTLGPASGLPMSPLLIASRLPASANSQTRSFLGTSVENNIPLCLSEYLLSFEDLAPSSFHNHHFA